MSQNSSYSLSAQHHAMRRPLLATVMLLLSTALAPPAAGMGGPQKSVREPVPMYKAFSHALPPSLIEALRADAYIEKDIVAEMGKLKFNKLSTNWYPLAPGKTHAPRFAAELAVHYLKEIDFTPESFAEQRIVGAEWWFQVKDTYDENIGFHYDKDEAMASDEMRLLMPVVSTVTYLTDVGGPTLIFNQTSEGNENIPIVAETGALFFPEVNKHVMFHGHLMHGVVGTLAPMHKRPPAAAGSPRITFLVNWWMVTPKPPNCRPPEPANVKRHIDATGYIIAQPLSTPAVQEILLDELPIETPTTITTVELPPEEKVHFVLPEAFKTGSHLLRWTDAQIMGGVDELNIVQGTSVSRVFRTPEPKVICFYEAQEGDSTPPNTHRVFYSAVRPFLSVVRPFLAEASVVEDALKTFGLSRSVLPAVVIHDTARDDTKVNMVTAFSVANIQQFVREYLAGRSGAAKEEL